MKSLIKTMLMAGAAAALLSSTSLLAQGGPGGPGGPGGGRNRGNFDPAQFQQQMMADLRDQMGVTDDSEWKVISGAIQKVMEAQRDMGGRGGMMMGMRRNRGGDPGGGGDPNAGGGRRGGRGFGNALPEQEALQTALENNASSDELKAKLATLRAARQAKQAALEKAQDDLKRLLTPKQEAIAYLRGFVR